MSLHDAEIPRITSCTATALSDVSFCHVAPLLTAEPVAVPVANPTTPSKEPQLQSKRNWQTPARTPTTIAVHHKVTQNTLWCWAKWYLSVTHPDNCNCILSITHHCRKQLALSIITAHCMAVASQMTVTVSNSPPHSTKDPSWRPITLQPALSNLSPKLNVAKSAIRLKYSYITFPSHAHLACQGHRRLSRVSTPVVGLVPSAMLHRYICGKHTYTHAAHGSNRQPWLHCYFFTAISAPQLQPYKRFLFYHNLLAKGSDPPYNKLS